MIKISITKEWHKAFMYKSAWNKAVQEACAAGVEFWQDRFSARHFSAAGAHDYGYDPRSKQYTRAKLKAKGHMIPLVWSGASRELAKIKDIRTGRLSARAVINAPTLNLRPTFRKGPRKGQLAKKTSMREEMTRVTAKEMDLMVSAADRALERLIEAEKVRFREDME